MTIDIAGRTALVTGASRGFGRAIAIALGAAGARVVGVARDPAPLEDLRAELGGSFTPVAADAADPVVAGQLIDAYRPGLLVLNAGAAPLARPIQRHTWQTFSRNWDVNVQHVFNWTREALLAPLEPGSLVIALSSGAAVRGSPLSGGYAGAKATIRFITSYAAAESERDGLDIRFVSLLPQLTPVTGLGAKAVAGYAARDGIEVSAFLDRAGRLSPRSRRARRSPTSPRAGSRGRARTCSPREVSVRPRDGRRRDGQLPVPPDLVAQLPGTGSQPDTVVPCPGWERRCRVPPRAASRSAMPCRPVPSRAAAVSNPVPSSVMVNCRLPPGAGEADVRPGGVGVLGDVLQGLERAEVHGRLDVLRVALNAVGLNRDRHRGLARLGLQGEHEALVGEQRRVDAPGQGPQVIERGPG